MKMELNNKEVFRHLIDSFLEKSRPQNGKNNLYVFQGFPEDFYAELQGKLGHLTFAVDEKYPSVDHFLGETNELLISVLQLKKEAWIYYEEFCVIYQNMRAFNADCNIIIVYNDIFDNFYPLKLEKNIFANLMSEELDQKEADEFKIYSDCKMAAETALVSFVNCHFYDDIGRKDVISCGFYEKAASRAEVSAGLREVGISRSELAKYADMLQHGKLKDRCYIVKGLTQDNYKQLERINLLAAYYNVAFKEEKEEVRNQNQDKFLPLFKKYWGEDKQFRNVTFYKHPGESDETEEVSQGIIVTDIVEQCEKAQEGKVYADIIVTAPTGSGKSLLFQLPSIYLAEKEEPLLTIVISPLVALMADQVRELEDIGVYNVTFINSDITYEERQRRLAGIRNKEYSIVYMSPELLLSYNIKNLIGERKLGMIVIDEAHLVTSWGRDFRVDYWFLGGYLAKLRSGSYYGKNEVMDFPVVCLTATAVFGGNDDVVGDLAYSLGLLYDLSHTYIGYVVRDNIKFTVRNPGNLSNEEKINLVNKRIEEFVKKGEKTIVYFPFTRQVEESYRGLQIRHGDCASKVTKYYGSLDKKERQKAYEDFRSNKATVMLATKAFGMGINITDIVNVYHYAPTGTLADYVQEIGRAARKLPEGHAIIDFTPTDMNSVKRLWGLSGIKKYQLQAMMKKLYGMYMIQKERHMNRARNLLFSADEFNFLFDTDNIDNTVKSGLMILSTDLKNTYRFNVITVRPKDLLTTQYIMIPKSIEENFLSEFGRYCEKKNDAFTRKDNVAGNNGAIYTHRLGDIYEIHLDALWKDKFNNLSFAAFKFKFFKGDLFEKKNQEHIVPNMRLSVHYSAADDAKEGFEKVVRSVKKISAALSATFNDIARGGKARAEFTFQDFKQSFIKSYGAKVSDSNLRLLLDLFVGDRVEDNPFAPPVGEWKFIIKKTHENSVAYTLSGAKATVIESKLNRYLQNMHPNAAEGRDYVDYLPIPPLGSNARDTKSSYQQLIASLLQLFDIASYEIDGGYNPQIFVRINDPLKLQSLSRSKNYTNNILKDISRRHENAIKILNNFMLNEIGNEERWNIIEQYFLGEDDRVDAMLNLKRTGQEPTAEEKMQVADVPAAPKAQSCKGKISVGEGTPLSNMNIKSWQELATILAINTDKYEAHNIPLPDSMQNEIGFGEEKTPAIFVWKTFNIAVFENIKDSLKKALMQEGWLVQTWNEENFELIMEQLRV